MTINSIKSSGGYEMHKLEQLEQQQRQAARKTAAEPGGDRISISEEGRIKAGVLKTAQESDGVRADLVADIKARIASGNYTPSSRDTAEKMVRQELDIWG